MKTTSFIPRSLPLTEHARVRMAQRNISSQEIEFVVRHGTRRYAAGAVHYHLRKKDIPQELRHVSNVTRLEGTTVIVSLDTGAIITVHRNRATGFQEIKRKS